MKIITALSLLISTVLYGQEKALKLPILHAFVFANTNDPSIGSSCSIDLTNMAKQAKIIADAIGYASDIRYFGGYDFSIANLNKSRDKSKIKDSDIVILFFSSHGFRTLSDTSEFPDIIFSRQNSNYVNAESIHNSFKRRFHPKLLITIIDACNGVANLSQSQIVYLKSSANPEFRSNLYLNEVHYYKRLFRESYGDIILCSSQKGQPALIDTIDGGGGLLTTEFIQLMQESAQLNDGLDIVPMTWDRFLMQIRTRVKSKSLMLDSDTISRYPVWAKSVKTLNTVPSEIGPPELSISIMRKTESGWTALEQKSGYNELVFTINQTGRTPEAATRHFKNVTYYLRDKKTDSIITLIGRPERNFTVSYEISDPISVYAVVTLGNGEKMDVIFVQSPRFEL